MVLPISSYEILVVILSLQRLVDAEDHSVANVIKYAHRDLRAELMIQQEQLQPVRRRI